jgi:hypothetical protein
MSSKSKTKGNSAERELCRFFAETFDGSFTRVPNSGAITGGKNAFRRQVLSDTQNRIYRGDIIAPDHMPRFVVESKFYAEFRFHQLLQPGSVPQLDTWIGQSMDAIEPNDLWCVCFKINLKGWYVAIHAKFCGDMNLGNHCVYTHATEGQFVVTDLKTFFTANCQRVLELTR